MLAGLEPRGALRGLTVPFDLIVTTVAGRERRPPDVYGRDVRGAGCCSIFIGAPGAANAAIDMFERDPSVRMIGPKVFRLPKAELSEELSPGRPIDL